MLMRRSQLTRESQGVSVCFAEWRALASARPSTAACRSIRPDDVIALYQQRIAPHIYTPDVMAKLAPFTAPCHPHNVQQQSAEG